MPQNTTDNPAATNPHIHIKLIPHRSALYEEAIVLRRSLLRTPLGLEYYQKDLDMEHDQDHLIVHYTPENAAPEVIGSVSIQRVDNACKIRQFAISSAWQGKGVGRLLLKAAEIHAHSLGYTQAFLNGRVSAQAFYERAGYTAKGEAFIEVTLPHIRMEKYIGDL